MRIRIALVLFTVLSGLVCANGRIVDPLEQAAPAVPSGPVPETVFATFHVKEGKDAQFLEIYKTAWSTYKRFGMVFDEPHILLKGYEDGKPCFYELLRWKTGEEPDHAPPEVKALWRQMEDSCEKRLGHSRGIEFGEVRVLDASLSAATDQATLGPHASSVPPTGAAASTETVLSVFRVRAGNEAQFIQTEAKAWSIYRKLGMTLASPRLMGQSVENGSGPYFVGVLTWRDHDAPDHAPEEVKAVWREMESLCEKRGGHRGIEFDEVQIIASQ